MVCKHPPLPTKPGGPDNWIEATKPAGLPPMVDCVARAIYWSGKARGPAGVSRAVRIAMGKVEDWAQGRGGVKPDTIAKARASVTILRAKQAQAKANNLSIPADEVIDLAFNPSQARGFHGRWVKIMEGLKKLKPGQSKTLHGPSGTTVKRVANGFKVTTQGHEQHASTPGKAATLTIDALTRASRPRRTARNMSAKSKAMDLTRTKR